MTRWLVVGAGAAGCVIAARLSEIESNVVTLVEAGRDHGASVGEPGSPVLDRPALLRPTEVVRVTGTPAEPYAQGSGLGGSSLVNAAVVVGDALVEAAGHELPISPATDLGPIARAAIRATPDAAPVALVARNGHRVSAADTYLRPVLGRGNLTVQSTDEVDRVVFDGRRAVGVLTTEGLQLGADHIVLCAGAIGTPTILLRSGVDTPGVGAGLQDHAGTSVSFEPRAPTAGDQVAIGATVERPGRQIVVMDRVPGRPEMGALIAGHLAVVSVGRVTVPDPDGPPLVELGQLSAPSDLVALAFVVREALDLLAAPELREAVGAIFVDDHGTPAHHLRDADAMRLWIRAHLGGYHHLAGSCRTGVALDADGSLRGYAGISVCDASSLGGVPLRNPYLTVVRQAERVARRLVGR